MSRVTKKSIRVLKKRVDGIGRGVRESGIPVVELTKKQKEECIKKYGFIPILGDTSLNV